MGRDVSMRDTIKDEGSRSVGERRYGKKSQNQLRYIPGEESYNPVAPGFCAGKNFNHNLQSTILRTILSEFAKTKVKSIAFASAALVLLCIHANVEAVPVFDTDIADKWPGIISYGPGRNSFEDNSLANRYPWWIHDDLKEVDNIEWIPSLDFKYKFTENLLYRFVGGSYEPGSIGWPHFEHYPAIPVIYTTREYVDFWGRFNISNKPAEKGDILSTFIEDYYAGQYIVTEPGWYVVRIYRDELSTSQRDGAVPGDYITFEATEFDTGRVHSVQTTIGIPIWTHHKDRIRVDLYAAPEPSTIVLFSIAALGFLRMKKCRNV